MPADEAGGAYAEVMRMATTDALGTRSVAEMIELGQRLIAILERHGDERGVDIATIGLGRSYFHAGQALASQRVLSAHMARKTQAEAPAALVFWLAALLVWGPTSVPEATGSASCSRRRLTGRLSHSP